MKVSIVTDEISQDLEVALEFGLKLGITNFAIRSVWGKNVAVLTQQELQKVKSIIDSFNVKVSCIFSPLYKCFLTDNFLQETTDGNFYGFTTSLSEHKKVFSSLLNAAKILNVSYVRIFGFLKYRFSHQKYHKKNEDPMRKACYELNKVSSIAKINEVYLLLENEHTCYIDTLEKLYDFLNNCRDDQLKLAIDVSNHLKAKFPSRELNLGIIDKLLDRTIDFHVKDFDASGKYVVVGNGIINWGRIFDFLKSKNYNEFITLEPHLNENRKELETSIRRVLDWTK